MTVLQAAKNLAGKLSGMYDDREAKKIAGMVMEKITGLTQTQRLVSKESLLSAAQQKQLEAFSMQLMQHKPVQYVLHEAWFAGLQLYVDENVLIPRPETEELTEWIINESLSIHHSPFTILDIGTGSGCIAISLKKKLATAKVYALDISEKALDIAEKNALFNNTEIEFLQADILNFDAKINLPLFDIIVSNPPYVKQNEAAEMAPHVLQFEPKLALFVPDNIPLLFYDAIAGFALKNLKPGKGKLYFEINETMGENITTLLEEKGVLNIRLRKDMQGKNRMAVAELR